MVVRFLLVASLFFVKPNTAGSQNTIELTVENGLSQGFVSSIAQDNNGYIWAGTINGLNRYDGYQFKVYRHSEADSCSVASDEIVMLANDHTGRMWVVTPSGIQYYNTEKDQFETPGVFRKHSAGYEKGVSIEGDRIVVANKETISIFKIVGPEPDNILTLQKTLPIRPEYRNLGGFNSIYCDDEKIRVGTYVGIFEISDDGTFRKILPEVNASIYQICYDRVHNQTIIQASHAVIIVDQNNRITSIPVAKMNYGKGMNSKKLGDQYVIFIGNGVRSWNGTALQETGIAFDKVIVSGFVDRQENLWIGFDGSGMVCIKRRKKTINRVLKSGETSSKKPVMDENGSIWLYSENKVNGEPDYSEYLSDGRKTGNNRQVYHREAGTDGRIWVVNRNSELAFLDKNGAEKTVGNPNPGKLHVTFGITALPDGKLMLLSANGHTLKFYDPATGVLFGAPEADQFLRQSGNPLNQIEAKGSTCSDCFIWLSGERGIVGLKPDWEKMTCTAVFPKVETVHKDRGPIRMIFARPDVFEPRILWIGAWNGFYKMDTRTGAAVGVTSYHIPETESVFCMAQTAPDHIWLGTQHGLVYYNISSGNSKLYTVKDGLPAGEFNRNTTATGKDGIIMMGTVNGYIAFYPDELKQEEKHHTVQISQVFRGGESVKTIFGEGGIYIPDITYDSANIMICFSSLDFLNQDALQYRFRVDASEEWLYNGYKNSVSLANIAPGDHLFEVQASLGGSEWGDSAFLHFTVTPPWWKTWWAQLFFMLLIAGPAMVILRNRRLLQKEKHRSALLQQQATYEQILEENRERLLTNIAHDLKTPITLINGLIESWDDDSSDNTRKTMTTLRRQGQEMNKMVNQIIDLNRLKKTGALPVNPVLIDLNLFIPVLMSPYRHLAEMKEIDLQTDIEPDIAPIMMDENQIRAILGNLMSNAVKFTPPGGHILFRIYTGDGKLHFSVADSGKGVIPEDRDKIFERYYQSRNARETGGFGIGLSYAAEMAFLAGGELGLMDSDPQYQGATFRFSVPLDKIRENMPESGADYAGNDQMADPSEEGQLILVVEDHPEMGDYIRRLLSGEYRVVLARDGLSGLEKARQLIPDLIISDVMMPEMTGTDMCRHIRNDIRTSHIPIILLTAKSDSESVNAGLRNGANWFLTKPFDREQLRHYVGNSLKLASQMRDYYRGRWTGDAEVSEEPAGITGEKEAGFIQEVNQIIAAHYSDCNFSVEKMATLLHISKTQLHRKIGALGGESAGSMIRLYRIRKARTMLVSEPALTVAEIAFACGFTDGNYFSTAFSREYGISPSNFKKGRISD